MPFDGIPKIFSKKYGKHHRFSRDGLIGVARIFPIHRM
jgi:hypothetical protein